CGGYCFRALKPILDRSESLQGEVDNLKHEQESEFKKSIEHFEAKQDFQHERVEEQFKQILQHIKSQIETVEENLQNLQKLMEVKKTDVGPPYQKIGSKYYYIEKKEKVSWFEAAHRCIAIGGHLISFKNHHEIDAIKKVLPPLTDYWIDINDLANEGEFVSVAMGSRATYLKWKSGEPNNQDNEDCGELNSHSGYRMNDYICSEKQLFICE
ncbi:hypothetical protein KR215_005253, partial [Drosophila sulfurigaster]